jgi:hypothetical protein
MYSDLAGLQSLIVGDTELITTDDTVSCQDSMACLIQPNGSTCQALPITMPVNVSVETRSTGRDVFGCEGESICEERDPRACVKSSISPNCHYHIVSAVRLLAKQYEYRRSHQCTDHEECRYKDEGDGVGSVDGNPCSGARLVEGNYLDASLPINSLLYYVTTN